MIVRVLGEGQYEVPDSDVARLDELDQELAKGVESGDEAFASALAAVLAYVRRVGTRLADDYLGPSDLALPHDDASREEVDRLLRDGGVIPS